MTATIKVVGKFGVQNFEAFSAIYNHRRSIELAYYWKKITATYHDLAQGKFYGLFHSTPLFLYAKR